MKLEIYSEEKPERVVKLQLLKPNREAVQLETVNDKGDGEIIILSIEPSGKIYRVRHSEDEARTLEMIGFLVDTHGRVQLHGEGL